MATIRWSARARSEFRAERRWLRGHRGAEAVARVTQEVAEAINHATENPLGYAWVGSIHVELAALPTSFRRVLTRTHRYVIYYRFIESADEVLILALRGPGQSTPILAGGSE